jgi:hypothetical protein
MGDVCSHGMQFIGRQRLEILERLKEFFGGGHFEKVSLVCLAG